MCDVGGSFEEVFVSVGVEGRVLEDFLKEVIFELNFKR